MFSPCSRLPSEVWTQVFGYLCLGDRLRVRAVCTDFRDLVDSSGLWKDWTVTLRRMKSEYNREFWKTLRRWRVSSAVLASPRGWKHIFTELPGLSTLILVNDCEAILESLQGSSGLRRLYLRRHKHMSFSKVFALLPPQLTHLSVCEYDKGMASYKFFLNVTSFDSVAHLRNLRSLVCHTTFCMHSREVLPTILSALPQLTHLSVSPPCIRDEPAGPEPPSLPYRSLTSLEIVDYVFSLPDDVMKMVPSLRSLALFFGRDYHVLEPLPMCLWLKDLPVLSSLVVVGGPCVREFVGSIPSSVTRLTLRPPRINSAEMTALSSQLPNLLHLHLEPRLFLGPDTALLPRLFPGLRSLRLRHERVPEEAVLSLAALKELQLLETQDPVPPAAALTSKLLELTQNRVRISQRPKPDYLRTCRCVTDLPSENCLKVLL